MSAIVERNKVRSCLIRFGPNDSDTFQGVLQETSTVNQPFWKRAANKLDIVYTLDQDKTLCFVQLVEPLAKNALLGYDSTIILLGSESTGLTLLLKGSRPDNTLFNTIEYLFSEIRKENENRLLFVSCFETVGATLVDYVGNYLGDNVQYSYSFSKTSVSLLRIQDTGRDIQVVKKMVSEERRNRNRQFVLQILVTSNFNSGEYFLSGLSFVLFLNCDSIVERLGQLSSLKIDPCSEPPRVLFYPFSTQNMNELIVDLVCSALGGNRLGAILVLANLQDLSTNIIESLVSFASSLGRVENNPSQCPLKLRVSLSEHREGVSHPRLYNLDSRLNDSQLEIDHAKHRFGVTRTRRPTPGSATWRSFLKSLKIMPSGESNRSNPTSPAISPSSADELVHASRNQYSENNSEDGGDLRYIHLASRESTFHKCFKCCLPKAVFNEFRSIFDVSESP
ncbi:hypothetical protein GpartN1_g4953.t1 [Galdieria partita]|uniref:Kinesin motor domain-containing protein n=1 Tax=Galdieria partita TaxID=83374 RepID=A0A9C7US38_9RHOD|nr:hypothetical protein GpartN1_g4953.t1 [Galdieria partita]